MADIELTNEERDLVEKLAAGLRQSEEPNFNEAYDLLASIVSNGLIDDTWNDLRINPITQARGNTELDFEQYRDTGIVLGHMRHDQADTFAFVQQVPHDWKQQSLMRLHMHVYPLANGAGTFAVNVRYAVQNVGEETPAFAGFSSDSMSVSLTTLDQFKHTLCGSVDIDMTGKRESCLIWVKITRDVTGADTYETNKPYGTGAANVAIASVDLHYQSNKKGTDIEFPGA